MKKLRPASDGNGVVPGSHYCEAHQGNTSHYAEHNCELCQAQAALAERDAVIASLRAEIKERAEECDRDIKATQKQVDIDVTEGLRDYNEIIVQQDEVIAEAMGLLKLWDAPCWATDWQSKRCGECPACQRDDFIAKHGKGEGA